MLILFVLFCCVCACDGDGHMAVSSVFWRHVMARFMSANQYPATDSTYIENVMQTMINSHSQLKNDVLTLGFYNDTASDRIKVLTYYKQNSKYTIVARIGGI